ncbi:MAG: cyclodeaminase/cyclohydrolase family protein [Acholeplasmataceae bacterium]|jgi:formiminotetrahydrofolate cyclodeaminase|nr:cyclodeaminase/cyclohydrolase family protein [Acholeplasmataceae bacterium]
MKLVEQKVVDFINEIDSKSPAPGGGSVAALCGAIGASLIRMVGHLTVEKKKFLALDSKIQLEFKSTLSELLMIKEQLVLLIDKDTDAFNMIMKSYSLPKNNEEEITNRNLHIQEATLEAIMVPLKVASLSMSALNHLDDILQHGNKSAISDLGVAILTLITGVEGACLNVLINLPSLDDQIARQQFKNQVNELLAKAHLKKDELMPKIYTQL